MTAPDEICPLAARFPAGSCPRKTPLAQAAFACPIVPPLLYVFVLRFRSVTGRKEDLRRGFQNLSRFHSDIPMKYAAAFLSNDCVFPVAPVRRIACKIRPLPRFRLSCRPRYLIVCIVCPFLDFLFLENRLKRANFAKRYARQPRTKSRLTGAKTY